MFIALYITACLPCDFVLKDFILTVPFSEHDVSYLCVSEEKNKPVIENFRQMIFQRFTDK